MEEKTWLHSAVLTGIRLQLVASSVSSGNIITQCLLSQILTPDTLFLCIVVFIKVLKTSYSLMHRNISSIRMCARLQRVTEDTAQIILIPIALPCFERETSTIT